MTTQRSARVVGLAGLIVLVAAAAQAQDSAAADRGNAKYQYACAPCHGSGAGDDGRKMLPGTDALRIKYRGKVPALLEERTDLNAKLLRVFVRRGSWSMPPFRPTELTDAEIEDIAVYLAKASRAAGRTSDPQR
jgi:mono/diheme cytochrome c family protein